MVASQPDQLPAQVPVQEQPLNGGTAARMGGARTVAGQGDLVGQIGQDP